MEPDPPGQPDEFISEPIVPDPATFTTGLAAQGLASLPGAFTWRGRRYEIVECLRHVKQSAPEGGHAGGERYLRRQVFEVRLDTGQRATIYIERQSRPGSSRESSKKRWFLYTLSSREGAEGRPGAPE
ncbi:MAG: DUF6504 family protein [Planctomycetota bacterium]|jgi:hypothetical protein